MTHETMCMIFLIIFKYHCSNFILISAVCFLIRFLTYFCICYRNVSHGTFNASPNKDGGVAQDSRSSLSTNRTSPIGVPIPRNSHVRQRNDSSSSGDSWQLVTGTGSLCGSTTANAPHLDNILAPDSDCKPSCTTCHKTRRTSQERSSNINDDETCVSNTRWVSV